jgi:hypothetical protein
VTFRGLLFIGCVSVAASATPSFAMPSYSLNLSRGNISVARDSSFNANKNSRPLDSINPSTINGNAKNGGIGGLNRKEQEAEQQILAEKQYEATLKAIKDGTYVPPTDPYKNPALRRKAIDDARIAREQLLAQRKLERERQLLQREEAFFARTRKGMELERSKTTQRTEHEDVDPIKLQQQLNSESDSDSLKNF